MSKTEQDRRKHVRILVRVLVDFDSEDTYLYDYSNDLSEGGIFIETEKPLPAGTPLTLRFTLPSIDRVFETKGAVRWVSGPKADMAAAQDKLPRGMGIQFVEMDEKDRDKIHDYIKSLPQEEKKPT